MATLEVTALNAIVKHLEESLAREHARENMGMG